MSVSGKMTERMAAGFFYPKNLSKLEKWRARVLRDNPPGRLGRDLITTGNVTTEHGGLDQAAGVM